MFNSTTKSEAIAELLFKLKDYDFRDQLGYPLFGHPYFYISRTRSIHGLEAIKAHGFKDAIGHPLSNCVDFQKLIELLTEE